MYLLNPHVGHLGIFVSAKVARKDYAKAVEICPPDEVEMEIGGIREFIAEAKALLGD